MASPSQFVTFDLLGWRLQLGVAAAIPELWKEAR